MIDTINFDMDSVLVNLSLNLARLDGYDDPVHWYVANFERDGEYMYPKAIERHVDDNCFVTCQPMPYYDEMKSLIKLLLQKGYKVNILSSCMDKDYSDKIIEQKLTWLRRWYAEEIKFFNEINIVRGSELKIQYVRENAILIDDYAKTKDAFIENGMGDQFVHYTNFLDCVEKLRELNII